MHLTNLNSQAAFPECTMIIVQFIPLAYKKGEIGEKNEEMEEYANVSEYGIMGKEKEGEKKNLKSNL